jgi:hypothetical protein
MLSSAALDEPSRSPKNVGITCLGRMRRPRLASFYGEPKSLADVMRLGTIKVAKCRPERSKEGWCCGRVRSECQQQLGDFTTQLIFFVRVLVSH